MERETSGSSMSTLDLHLKQYACAISVFSSRGFCRSHGDQR